MQCTTQSVHVYVKDRQWKDHSYLCAVKTNHFYKFAPLSFLMGHLSYNGKGSSCDRCFYPFKWVGRPMQIVNIQT